MKKLLALCLAACMSFSLFTACEDTPAETTTTPAGPITPTEKNYKTEDGVLVSCIGQADENGVYVVPEAVTAIGESAFAGDTSLKELVIGSHVKFIGSGAFENCTSLEKVTVSEGVEVIGSYAFFGCSALTDISLPSTVDTLHQYAFYGCTGLEAIDLSHIRRIEESAFLYCSALEKVTFSAELEAIDGWAFAQCTALSETNLAALTSLTAIGDSAFSGCSMLRSVEIPEGVETIGKLAFYECSRLTDVKLSSTVKTVDYAAFNFTPWYQENDDEYLVVGDGVLIKCGVHPDFIDLSDKGIKAIGATAFWNATIDSQSAAYGYKYATELETVVLPETVTSIGASAFAGCYSLKEIVLPAGVTEIGNAAFNIYSDGVTSTAKVDFTACEDLKTIGAYAFQGCTGITSMALPVTVEQVGPYAFAGTEAFDGFMEEAAKAEKEADRYYVTGDGVLLAAYVVNGQTKITVPEGVKTIAGGVFIGWDTAYIPGDKSELSTAGVSKYNISYEVKEVSFPETLTEIGESAFYRMLSVESLVLPSSLEVIGDSAFSFCSALSSVSGGASVKEIGDEAFSFCTMIPGFQFSENTTSIGEGVFMGCASLQNVVLPKGLAHPGLSLFDYECVSLKTVTMDPSARPFLYTILGGLPAAVDVRYYK